MASQTRRLTEAELNSPDLDDNGQVDVERYPIPVEIKSGNAYLDRVWAEAAKGLNAEEVS